MGRIAFADADRRRSPLMRREDHKGPLHPRRLRNRRLKRVARASEPFDGGRGGLKRDPRHAIDENSSGYSPAFG
jgi:hypothetical protein